MGISALAGAPECDPLLIRLIPAFILLGVPTDPKVAAMELGLRPEQLAPVREDAVQAELDVPPGVWRIWPSKGVALWVGRRHDAMPHAPFERVEIDLGRAVTLLAQDGLWPSELRLRTRNGWTPRLSVARALRLLAEEAIEAVYGLWSDQQGRALRVAIFRGGELRAETEALAERVSIVLGGLSYA